MSKDVLTNLYKEQAAIIYRYLLKHGCRREVAEEIVHDSFVKAIEHLDNLEPRKLSSWIFMVALNNYRNYLKKASVRKELLIDESHFIKNFVADDQIEDTILANEKAKETRSCLNNLKESYKELLILKYEMQLTYQEISKMLGLPVHIVKTYLFRARNQFKSIWRDGDE